MPIRQWTATKDRATFRTSLLTSILLFGSVGCTSPDSALPPADRLALTAVDPGSTLVGQIGTVHIVDGEAVSSVVTIQPPRTLQLGAGPAFSKPDATAATPLEKIDPQLASIAQRGAISKDDETAEVLVTFTDTHAIPRFPAFVQEEPRNSLGNQKILDSTKQMVSMLQSSRASEYVSKSADFVAAYGAKIGESFWLINGMTMVVPLRHINAIASRADVQYIEANNKGTPPPTNQSSDVRALLNTDPYFAQTNTYIGILDTGVRATHTLLTRLGAYVDCVNGTLFGCQGSSTDPSDNHWD